MYLYTLNEWLSQIETCHAQTIALGLDRVREVASRLNLISPTCPVIIVGGTNGKGSTVAVLEALYLASGYRVGAFTSPILYKHNEYVRVNGQNASDEAFCEAYAQIETVRGDVTLTPFEFYTLAALIIFKSQSLDAMLLEVGLGGRLDAVNMLDADVAIVTSISLDHQEYLGHTLSEIAREKAGIFRLSRPAICGDLNPPQTLLDEAKQVGAMVYRQGQDFTYQEQTKKWSWQFEDTHYSFSILPKLATQNLSCALMAITLLQKKLPVSDNIITSVIPSVTLSGRGEIYSHSPLKMRDVAHNEGSVAMLAEQLKKMPNEGKTHAVFSMLADKDISTCLKIIDSEIDHWHIAPLQTKRAASLEKLQASFSEIDTNKIHWHGNIQTAYQHANQLLGENDRLITFGSFHVISSLRGRF